MNLRNLCIAIVVFLTLMTAYLAAILALNSGHFAFTLDDPYIHLALAENILRGHYGVNLGEFSAPSSSILWPFLITPFSRTAAAEYLLLAFNTLASAGTLWVAWRITAPSAGKTDGLSGKIGLVILLLFIPAANLVGLAFTGMEHSFQVFLSALIVLGLIREVETGRLPAWTLAAIGIAPLIRYECLAISLPALVFLYFRGHRVSALCVAGGVALFVAGFSAFLLHLGLEPLPNSVLAKSGVAASPGNVRLLISNLRAGIQTTQGAVLALAMLLLVMYALTGKSRDRRNLAWAFATAAGLHLLAGQYTVRYELYVWTSALLVLLYLHKDRIQGLSNGIPFWKTAGVSTLAVTAACAAYIDDTLTIPLNSANIYEQHYQMHRFVTEYYHKPVAINDLGWVSYRNDLKVLDLWGLASVDALRAKRANPGNDTVWMSSMTRARGVRFAMIYDSWFTGVPASWGKVGDLHLWKKAFITSKTFVSFYALDCETFRETRQLTREFEKSLPRGVRFDRSHERTPPGCDLSDTLDAKAGQPRTPPSIASR